MDAAATALKKARHVLAVTGAGISAESGVPTFRDAQTGLWARYDPMDLATPEAFARDPELVWSWYAWRRELVARAEPNAGHRALARLAALVPRLTLVTQNVDGLHARAGSPDVVELHGNLFRTKRATDGAVVERWDDDGAVPPRCPATGALLRPDVVWFGEALPAAALERAATAAVDADVCLVVGTSSLVYPAASIPQEALRRGAFVIELNPAPTPLTPHVAATLQGPAGTVLPALLNTAFGASA